MIIASLSISSMSAYSEVEISQELRNQKTELMNIDDSDVELKKEKLEIILRGIMNSGNLRLFNYALNEEAIIERPYDLTYDDAILYVPQIDEIMIIFEKTIKEGKLPIEAVVTALTSKNAIELIRLHYQTIAEEANR